MPCEAALVDSSLRLVRVNGAWQRSLELVRGPLRPETAFVYLDEDDPLLPKDSRAARTVVKGIKSVVSGRSTEFAFEYSRPEAGGARWFRLTATPYRDETSSCRALVLRFDQTDEQVDRSRQALHTFALKRATEFIGILESSGAFTYANDRLCGTLGYSFRDLIDRHIWDIDPNFPEDAFRSAVDELRQLGTLAIESHFRTVEGLAFPVEVTLSHYEGQGGENVLLFAREPSTMGDLASGSFRFQQKVAERTSELAAANSRLQEEIVSHRRTEEELRTSQQRLALALWGTSLGLWDWSLRDGAMTFDERWCTMLGYEMNEIEPRLEGWTGLVHPDDDLSLRKALEEHLAGRSQLFEQVHRLNHKNGEYRWFMARGRVAQRDDNGVAVRVIGTLQDITERKQLESQLLQSQKMEAIGQLAGGVAHDFNNLLTAINGYADLVLRNLEKDSPHKRKIEEIRKAGKRAGVLTSRLLAFGRKQVLQPELIHLNHVITSMEALLRPAIGEEIKLELVLEDNLPLIRADLSQMEQVILNLAVNARDAMPSGGTLTISTSRARTEEVRRVGGGSKRDYVCLSMRDTGVGIPDEMLPRVFEPFFTTKEVGQGTGLGLSMVYGTVRQSDGFIEIRNLAEDLEDDGVEVLIYLPTAQKSLAHSLPVKIPGTEALEGHEQILLVEDEPSVRVLMESSLESLGYQVASAGSAEEALSLLEKGALTPEALVSDVVLPGMNGVELARRLQEEHSDLRVLLVSGYPRDALDRKEPMEGMDFLQKPFEVEEFLHRVRQVLDRRALA